MENISQPVGSSLQMSYKNPFEHSMQKQHVIAGSLLLSCAVQYS